jgi:serine/threonine protein kinase
MTMASATDISRATAIELLERAPEVERRLGTTIAGSYRIVRHIGSGGSSHVFAAEHTRLGKPVAVKILRAEVAVSQRAALRFRREATAIARLQHEHIVSVIDCGELDERIPFLVMELLEGEDLRSLLRREGPLPARRAVQIVIEACRALAAVHAAGLIHRDLKPENLFITHRSGGEDWCKVLDFGVAKQETSVATAQDSLIGTVRYMAPEQLSDSSAVDPTTDVYALGAILYECLAGAPSSDAVSVHEIMYQIMNREPTPLLERCPHLPPALAQAVHRALARERERRPQSAAEFAALLQDACERGGSSATAGATVSDRTLIRPAHPSWSSRRRGLFSLAMVGALGTVGFALGLFAHPLATSSAQAVDHPGPRASSTASPPAKNASRPTPEDPSVVTLAEPKLSTLRRTDETPSAGERPPARREVVRPALGRNAAAADEPKRPAVRVGGFDPANPYSD